MQNNIIKIIQLIHDNYEICNKIIDDKYAGNKILCKKIVCSNCPLKENNPFINKKYGDYNDQSV